METEKLIAAQRAFFETGATKSYAFRKAALQRLRAAIQRQEGELLRALQSDLGKAPLEGYMAEVGLTLDELGFVQKKLAGWMKPRRAKTPLTHFPASSRIYSEPYGLCLVMAPWNYPFLLSMEPLVGAVAAGNCVVLKPSAYAPAISAAMKKLCENCFEPGHVAVVEGGRQENTALLNQRFDYIFFTGSVAVGKTVMAKASENLVPVTLELGGKSPCIVDETADIELAGRRIAFGKFLNAGQTCVAPDYLLVHRSIKQPLHAAIQKATTEFFGAEPLKNEELPRIVNQKHFERLKGLVEGQPVVFGGVADEATLRIAPTLLDEVAPEAPVMQEEIFGPVLPTLVYDDIGEAIRFVTTREKPLALYLFSRSDETQRRVLEECSFGGGCVNDTIMHLPTSHLPFGGVGQSGMGSYHGKKSFETFSHQKSIVKKLGRLDLPVRYHPYTAAKESILRRIMK